MTRWSLLLTSEYDFILQMNTFIASDEIVSAIHLQIRITLQANMFIASDERVLFWGRTLLVLEMNGSHAGDERLSVWDECVEKTRLSFSHTDNTHTNTQLYSYQQLPNRFYVEMIAIVTATYLRNGCCHVEEIQKVSRCTTAFLVALKWSSVTLNCSSRPSK